MHHEPANGARHSRSAIKPSKCPFHSCRFTPGERDNRGPCTAQADAQQPRMLQRERASQHGNERLTVALMKPILERVDEQAFIFLLHGTK